MTDQQCCGNCQFWITYLNNGDGYCRRHPPVIVDTLLKESIENPEHSVARNVYNPWDTAHMVNATEYPACMNEDWCGEWQYRAKRELTPEQQAKEDEATDGP